MNWSKAYDIAQYEMHEKRHAAAQQRLAQESRAARLSRIAYLAGMFNAWSWRLIMPAAKARRAAAPTLAHQSR